MNAFFRRVFQIFFNHRTKMKNLKIQDIIKQAKYFKPELDAVESEIIETTMRLDTLRVKWKKLNARWKLLTDAREHFEQETE